MQLQAAELLLPGRIHCMDPAKLYAHPVTYMSVILLVLGGWLGASPILLQRVTQWP